MAVHKRYEDWYSTGGGAERAYGSANRLEYLEQRSGGSLTAILKEYRSIDMAEIWLTLDAENTKLQMPWLPENYKLTCGSKHKTVDITGLGELVILQGRPPYTISWSSRFPHIWIPGAPIWTEPQECKKRMLRMKNSKWPAHLTITKCEIDMYVVITQFNCSEKGGDPGSLYYDITLKEWREVTARQLEVNPETGVATIPEGGTETRSDNRTTPTTYAIKTGDSLRSIAKKIYGDESRWEDIYDLNRDSITHPMFPGTQGDVLQLPQ